MNPQVADKRDLAGLAGVHPLEIRGKEVVASGDPRAGKGGDRTDCSQHQVEECHWRDQGIKGRKVREGLWKVGEVLTQAGGIKGRWDLGWREVRGLEGGCDLCVCLGILDTYPDLLLDTYLAVSNRCDFSAILAHPRPVASALIQRVIGMHDGRRPRRKHHLGSRERY